MRFIFIAIKPTITRDLNATYAGIKNEEIILSIAGTGNPHPTCQWFKNNTELTATSDEHLEFREDKTTNEYFLIIKNANQNDIGEYQSQLTNAAGVVKSKKSKVTVQKQPVFIKTPQAIIVNENETAKFECQIDALPQPKITWLFEGKPVTPKEGFEVHTDQATGISVLTIKQTLLKHAGKITVKAENSSGSIEETVQCLVNSKMNYSFFFYKNLFH